MRTYTGYRSLVWEISALFSDEKKSISGNCEKNKAYFMPLFQPKASPMEKKTLK